MNELFRNFTRSELELILKTIVALHIMGEIKGLEEGFQLAYRSDLEAGNIQRANALQEASIDIFTIVEKVRKLMGEERRITRRGRIYK